MGRPEARSESAERFVRTAAEPDPASALAETQRKQRAASGSSFYSTVDAK